MPATQFPSYLNAPAPTGQMQSLYRQAPGIFNTQGVEDSYNAQIGMNTAQGLSTTGAMGRAAESRAFQSGGKVGSSFAAADAMLPYLQQNQTLLGDEADYKLRAAQNRFQAQAGLAGQIGGMQQQRTGNLLNYDLASQQRAQQGGQFDKTLAEQQSEFGSNNSLRLRQQSFAEKQYADQLALQQSAYSRMGGGYGGAGGQGGLPNWGAVSSIKTAQNAALGQPMAANYWQQIGTAANQGKFSNTPVFGTGF